MKVVAVILTLNEAKHLPRCIESLKDVADEIVIADCFSTDETLEIAKDYGAKLIQREWVNYATQFNWALTQINKETEWVLRIDADEYLTPELAVEVRERLSSVGSGIDGIFCNRYMTFQGKLIRYGGLFSLRSRGVRKPLDG